MDETDISTENGNAWVLTAAVLVGALAVGIGIGYILGKRSGTVTIVPAEPSKKDDNQLSINFTKEDDKTHIEVLAENDAKIYILEPSEEEEVVEEDQYEETKYRNVFASTKDDAWDYEAELSTRTGEAPYIIHRDEFLEDEMGYSQSTVTYYQGDDIMADEKDVPIYGHGKLMGFLRWGHGSKDSNIVYVRNEQLHQEWEILLHTGSFELEILGFEADRAQDEGELRHSVQKFRAE